MGLAGTSETDRPALPEASAVPLRAFARVVSNESAGGGRRLRLAIPGWPGSSPGQFVMVGAGAVAAAPRWDPLLPRPMAVYRDPAPAAPGVAEEAGDPEIELLYKVVGRGTRLLGEAIRGDHVSIVGPLGVGFRAHEDAGAALLVGGGTGIASLYELAKRRHAEGCRVVVLLGARTASDGMGESDFEALGVELVIATEDGSRGIAGRVTVPLEASLARFAGEGEAVPTVYAVGPTPMMRACAELAARFGAPCWVSLENPMACGFGVCLGCAAPRAEGGFSLVCRAGPVFEAREIDWAGLP